MGVMGRRYLTLLAKGERIAITGTPEGKFNLITIGTVKQAPPGFFNDPVPVNDRFVRVPRIVKIEGESIRIDDEVTLQTARFAALYEVLEFECAFDEVEKNWYVRENSCVTGKVS
jgi:hypothetical protein